MAKKAGKKKQITSTTDAAAAAVQKKFKGTPQGAGSTELITPRLWLSTGSMSLDRVCRGINPGGVPVGPTQGRIIHIAGEWSTGKSLILDHIFKSVQDNDGRALCLESEGSRDPHFAMAIGLDLEKLYVARPQTIEEAIDFFLAYHAGFRKEHKSTKPFVCGMDSLDSMESTKTHGVGMTEGGGWRYGGGRSEALGVGLKKVAAVCSRYPTTLVLLNQTRDNPGVMFGSKKRTPGGNPPHFYASLELMLTIGPKGDIRAPYEGAKLTPEQRKRLGMRATERGDVIGRWIRAKVSKSKVSSTHAQEADFYISFRKGINPWAGMLQRLLHEGKISLKDEKIKFKDETFENENAWVDFVKQNPSIIEEI